MSIANNGVANAEVTLLFTKDDFGSRRDGIRMIEHRALPWCFIRFGGDAEDRYVMPLEHIPLIETTDAQVAVTEDAIGNRPFKTTIEFTDFKAFPQAPTNSGSGPGDNNIAGPHGVMFFGGV